MYLFYRTIKDTATLYNHFKYTLIENGKNPNIIEMYHKSTDQDSVDRILSGFGENSEIRLVFATVAFGMGIDISDVKLIVHWGMPKSHLDYWQEVGRAGRDGSDAYAVCFAYRRSLISSRSSVESSAIISQVKNLNCLRQAVLSNFLCSFESQPVCSCTMNCLDVCKCNLCKCCHVCYAKCKCVFKKNLINVIYK